MSSSDDRTLSGVGDASLGRKRAEEPAPFHPLAGSQPHHEAHTVPLGLVDGSSDVHVAERGAV